MSDLADCFAATVERPDGLVRRNKLIARYESRGRSANPAQTADHSLVIDGLELANSRPNTLGAVSG